MVPSEDSETSQDESSSYDSTTDEFELIDQISKDFLKTFDSCSEKIWPSFSLNKLNVFFVQTKSPSYMLDFKQSKLVKIKRSDLPKAVEKNLYFPFIWNEKTSVAFNFTYPLFPIPVPISTKRKIISETMVHESFHFVQQTDWQRDRHLRGMDYPLSFEPRLFRKMLFDHLLKYFNSKGGELDSLKKAAYWYHRWKMSYPNEVAYSTDDYEGSAAYVQHIYNLLANYSCEVSEEELLKGVISQVMPSRAQAMDPTLSSLSLSQEGYSIGALSFFILRWLNKTPNLFERIRLGESPLDVLFSNIEKLPEEINTSMKQLYVNKAYEKNQTFSSILDPLLKSYDTKDPNFIRVSFHENGLQNFAPLEELFSQTRIGRINSLPLATDSFAYIGSKILTLKAGSVIFRKYQSQKRASFDCRPDATSIEFLIEKKNVIELEPGLFQFSSPLFDGVLKGSRLRDDIDNEWVCIDSD